MRAFFGPDFRFTISERARREVLEFLIGLKQIEQILLRITWKKMNAAFASNEINRLAALAAIRQFARSLGIQITKRKALQTVPVVGALIGASFDGTFVNDVGRAAYMSYRRRWIAERGGDAGVWRGPQHRKGRSLPVRFR